MRNETRMFHLARIIEANLGGKSSLAENTYLAGMDSSFGIFKGNPSYHAEIFFSGEAAELVRNQYWHKDQKTTETGDGLILRLPVHDDREILTKILQYGSQAQVLGPPELVDKIKAETRLLSHMYK